MKTAFSRLSFSSFLFLLESSFEVNDQRLEVGDAQILIDEPVLKLCVGHGAEHLMYELAP